MKIFNGNITQLNTGTLEGKLFNSFNCDLVYDKGKISISQQTILTTDTITNMTTPVAFKYFDTKWFALAGRILVNDGTPQGVFSADGSSGVPTSTISSDYSDMELFGDVLLVTTTDKLYSKATDSGNGTGAYTSRRTFAAGTSPAHMLCVYNNRAYWVDTRGQIFSMSLAFATSTTTATDFTFNLHLFGNDDVLWMRPHATGIYIGTLNPDGGESYVYDWNGETADVYRNRYKIPTQAVLGGYVDENNTLWVVDYAGRLLQFTGSGFTEKGRFPVKRNVLYKSASVILNDRWLHPNGMTAIDGRISILINNRLNSTTAVSYLPNIHSGIWEFDGVSLYHKFALSNTTPAGTIIDYGQMNISRAGALANVNDKFATTDATKGNFLAGAAFYKSSSTSSNIGYGIWTDNYFDNIQKAGFFSTQQIRAEHFTNMFNSITTLYNPTSGMSFVVKYRTNRESFKDFNATWASGTTLTTTESTLSAGDEITILQGRGSGRIAHASNIAGLGTYTITLDETISGIAVGSTCVARRENWKKLNTITNTNTKFQVDPISKPDTLIELKVAMLGTGEVTVDEMVLDNVKNQ